jgi:hypothetical protein
MAIANYDLHNAQKKRERHVAEWAEWDEQLSSSCERAIVTESAAGAARFDRRRHLLRQNCRTQRRRKRASNLRNFESHLKCSRTASAYLSRMMCERMMRYGACFCTLSGSSPKVPPPV